VAKDEDDGKSRTIMVKTADEIVVSGAEVGVVVRVAEVVQTPSRWLFAHLPASLRWLASFEWVAPVVADSR